MKLKTRRILFVVCIFLFILIFPLVALKSFGYHYDWQEKKIIRTGIIYITPNPQDNLKFFINGKEEKENLSVKGLLKKDYAINNLMPQNYEIKITKNGYSQWEKRLFVFSGLSTYAQPLLLPLKPMDNLIFEEKNINSWSFSDNFKKIAYLKKINDQIIFFIYNIENKTTNSLILDDMAPISNENFETKIYWDNNSENIILILNSKISLLIAIQSNNNNITLLKNMPLETKITTGAWAQNINQFIFQTNTKELYMTDIFSNINSVQKITDNIIGFATIDNTIYYLDNKNFYLYSVLLDNLNNLEKKQISNEPLQVSDMIKNNTSILDLDTKIIISNTSDIAIINPNKDLFIIKQNSNLPIYIANNVSFAEFSAKKNLLLYGSSFEIFTYSLQDKTKNLITRTTQKIEKISWYKDFEHIWFFNNNMIKNIELDPRPTPNIIDFMAVSAPLKYFTYNAKTNFIYYDQTNNNTLSIHRLEVGN